MIVNWKVVQINGKLWVRMWYKDYRVRRRITTRKEVPDAIKHFKAVIDKEEN